MKKQEDAQNEKSEPPECFIIMPIADCDGYSKGHFKHVCEDIIKPACRKAGFVGVRADEVKQSNLIHLDILQRLIEAPMAVCDLSTRNPNVLFELALRQAFDKPVCLVQEVGTPAIFDISPFRYTEYRKERVYHEVLEDQTKISEGIKATHQEHLSGKGINSIVKLLGLSKPASVPEISEPDANSEFQHLILFELNRLRDELKSVKNQNSQSERGPRGSRSHDRSLMRDMMRHADSLINSATDEDDLKMASMVLDDCRTHWTTMMNGRPPREREQLIEYDFELDLLTSRLSDAAKQLRSKGVGK